VSPVLIITATVIAALAARTLRVQLQRRGIEDQPGNRRGKKSA